MKPLSTPTTLAAVVLAVSMVPAVAEEIDREDDRARVHSPETGSVYELPSVEVRAPRALTSVGGASAIRVHVDSLSLSAAPTVEELFRELPMLHVRRNSRGEGEISTRGSASRQVAVLVDGVPITLSWDARADVSIIPATALSEAVFIRGLSSMLYGPNVLGGVVDTRVGQVFSQPERTSYSLTMGADDVGSFGTTVSTTVPFETDGGSWLLRGGVGFRDSPGDPLAGDVTDRASMAAESGLRLNTDARHVDGFVALRYRADGGAWTSFSGSSFRAERGIAAELGAEDGDARFWRYPRVARTVGVLSMGTGDRRSPLGGSGDLEASLGVDVGRTDIDAFESADYDVLDTFEDGEDRTITLRLLGDQTLGDTRDLRGSFTVAEVRHDEFVPDGESRFRQRLWSGGVEHVWRLVEPGHGLGELALSTGGAYDVAQTRQSAGREPLDRISQLGGRIGVSALLPDRRTILHAGVSRRGRFPSLRELYSGALNRFEPNPDLEPEKVLAAEAGVTRELDRGQIQVVGFHHRVDDAVVRITLPDRKFQRVNRNELRSIGLELLGSYALGRVEVSGTLTVQDVTLTDTDTEDMRRPENLPETSGSLDVRVPLGAGFVGGAGLDYTGSQFALDLVSGDDTALDGAALFDVSASRTWSLPASLGGQTFSLLEARVSIENLTDETLFDQIGLPRPGRRFRFELRLR